MSVSYGGDSITFGDGSIVSSGSAGFKNKIINGHMMIDQRNAGASVTPADGAYTLDRWSTIATAASKLSIQQNAGSVSTLTTGGFLNYLGITSLSAYSVGAGDVFGIQQRIEGFNTSDLQWGTANAKTVTLSAWVYSSLTGTFGGSIINSAANYSYPFTYTISTANTWTQISITITGPTAGTWIGATNGIGVQVNFGVGGGATYSGTAGAWAAQQKYTATGAVSVVGTNGATFYITGVQLEKGTTASSFEFRSYQKELMLCQRYLPYWKFDGSSQVFTNSFVMSTTVSGVFSVTSPVPTRVAPTGVTVSSASHFAASEGDSGITFNSFSLHSGSYTGLSVTWGSGTAKTAFRPIVVYNASTSAYFYGTGCEL